MISPSTWFRYLAQKFHYSVTHTLKNCSSGQSQKTVLRKAIWTGLRTDNITYLHRHKGREMAPTIGSDVGTLLVRRIAISDPFRISTVNDVFTKEPLDSSESCQADWYDYETVSVGDVVVVKDPDNSESHLVRRLAAAGGSEMVSTDEKDDPFVLQQGECWVLSDNEALRPKEAKDSRTFGPVQMLNIVGRVIYCMRNTEDHGPVQNSSLSMEVDAPVLEIELDVEEMAENHKEEIE